MRSATGDESGEQRHAVRVPLLARRHQGRGGAPQTRDGPMASVMVVCCGHEPVSLTKKIESAAAPVAPSMYEEKAAWHPAPLWMDERGKLRADR